MDPVWPVDVTIGKTEILSRILGQLMYDAQFGFLRLPYVHSKRHDLAQIPLEVGLLQDLVIEGINKDLSQQESERLLRFRYLVRTSVLALWRGVSDVIC